MNNQIKFLTMQISNQEFLQAIFGEHFIWAHVTDFFESPKGGSLEWLGGHYINYELRNYANQYFTISLFNETSDGQARRRKELFQSTYCIVLDDIWEKIDLNSMIADMIAPSWILETSPGSQQWGYILDPPCDDRQQVENLLTGLITKLCPDGIDSGMAGVTRYVRLPEGWNNKLSKMALNNNKPFKCQMLIWQPEIKIDIASLAQAFDIDLTKSNKFSSSVNYESLEDNYAANHPAWLQLQIKDIIGEGKYNISCPWTYEHTDPSDDRATVFIRNDGHIGFKCHHGHCEKRTSIDLFEYLKETIPDWNELYNSYRKKLAIIHPVKPCPIKFKSRR